MEAHLKDSQKSVTLEAENQTLKAAKHSLEAELEAMRKPAAPVMLELNNGDELEVRFLWCEGIVEELGVEMHKLSLLAVSGGASKC